VLMSGRYLGSGSLMNDRGRPYLSSLAQEILFRVTEGQTVKVIASNLGTSRDKVDWQMRLIYRRFRVKGVAQLVHAAIREGWIEHPALLPLTRLGLYVKRQW
jgi:DNA-binding CsgD family transcriptional regulator